MHFPLHGIAVHTSSICLDNCESVKYEYTFDSVHVNVQKESQNLDLQTMAYSRISTIEDEITWKMRRYDGTIK